MTTVACPRCDKPVAWTKENASRPFCCERCKNIDYGAWANEEYRIANATPPDGDDQNAGIASRLD